jgi:nitrile hydratase beta subunit-like protein
VNTDLLDVDGAAAPPRSNGEVVFETPWQSRVFGLCAAIVETCFHGDREPFRQRLIAAITAEPDRPYWGSWTIALEQLALDAGLLDELAIERRIWLSGESAGVIPRDDRRGGDPTG